MGSPPVSSLSTICLAGTAQLVVGQQVCVVKGSLRGQIGVLLSVKQNTVLMQLMQSDSTVFLRVPAELVATHDTNG